MSRIIAGDVGGTKTTLALFDDEGHDVAERTYASASHASLEEVLAAFGRDVRGSREARALAVGVAGPVEHDRCRTTNLPWSIDAREVERAAGIPRVKLVNDFAAVAYGLSELRETDVEVLQAGDVDPQAPVAVLGAGTGLGEAVVVREGGTPRVMPTEGGHTDLAARDAEELALLAWLLARHPAHVSVERVLSGPGLVALWEFVTSTGRAGRAAEIVARMEREDPGAVIGAAGVAGSDAACAQAVRLFARIYGAEAGNLALKTLPFGGLYVAGGIAPKMMPLIREHFLPAFLAKGRMAPLLEKVRVSVVLHANVGLLGAASLARRL